ncbi:P-loop containing nucleoside triphosphate hydrolase protein [Lentinula aciculospora]|uniref:RNA helicase n=1 Tax=Lentinula aciculospora TaxID=153920 RepID=A0A9W9DUF2_9AGAR|nr:P-loop containing nucleoside triphosphate hydrolase protein [Lentinula aciculospora]
MSSSVFLLSSLRGVSLRGGTAIAMGTRNTGTAARWRLRTRSVHVLRKSGKGKGMEMNSPPPPPPGESRYGNKREGNKRGSSKRIRRSPTHSPSPSLKHSDNSPTYRPSPRFKKQLILQEAQNRIALFQAERERERGGLRKEKEEEKEKEEREKRRREGVRMLRESMVSDRQRQLQRERGRGNMGKLGSGSRWKYEIEGSLSKERERRVGREVQQRPLELQKSQKRRIIPLSSPPFDSRIQSGQKPSWSQKPSTSAKPSFGNKPSIKPNNNGLPQLKEFYRPPPSFPSYTQRKLKLSTFPSFPKTSPHSSSSSSLSSSFAFPSPPLLPGLLSSLHDILGPEARPTDIQRLSIENIVDPLPIANAVDATAAPEHKEYLLASETGSGKSIAYLLPLLQSLKLSEWANSSSSSNFESLSEYTYTPRSLILAPTHELARQLSGFAKMLCHEIKLRVVCTSKANVGGRERGGARGGVDTRHSSPSSTSAGNPDIMVSTPMKFLEMIFGRGWDNHTHNTSTSSTSASTFNPPTKRTLNLTQIEWIIIDEADVLFDPDFNTFTRLILEQVARAKGRVVESEKEVKVLSAGCYPEVAQGLEESLEVDNSLGLGEAKGGEADTGKTWTLSGSTTRYPFNLILTTATIPPALLVYLEQYHPMLFVNRSSSSLSNTGILRSPNLHHLPPSLKIEHVNWSGGNKLADIEKRLRAVWMEDERIQGGSTMAMGSTTTTPPTEPSKIIIFCNKSTKVLELGDYLERKGIKTVVLTSTIRESLNNDKLVKSDVAKGDWRVEAEEENSKGQRDVEIEGKEGSERRRGSNKHLNGFLNVKPSSSPLSTSLTPLSSTPHVLLTTSLLSRGLDFSPSVKHVFIVDEPRNVVDFLHRAGRTGRAGREGVVVVFGRGGGRGGIGRKGLDMEWRGGRGKQGKAREGGRSLFT